MKTVVLAASIRGRPSAVTEDRARLPKVLAERTGMLEIRALTCIFASKGILSVSRSVVR
jgi:hypothetical protein